MDFSFRVRLQNPCRAARMGILYKPSLLSIRITKLESSNAKRLATLDGEFRRNSLP
jgi:hypothetical protein